MTVAAASYDDFWEAVDIEALGNLCDELQPSDSAQKENKDEWPRNSVIPNRVPETPARATAPAAVTPAATLDESPISDEVPRESIGVYALEVSFDGLTFDVNIPMKEGAYATQHEVFSHVTQAALQRQIKLDHGKVVIKDMNGEPIVQFCPDSCIIVNGETLTLEVETYTIGPQATITTN